MGGEPNNRGRGHRRRLAACFAAVAICLFGWSLSSALAAGSTSWTAEVLPQPPESGGGHETYGVSCLSPDDCIAVGGNWSLEVHTRVTLAEHWDGTSWSPLPTPNPPGLEEGWKFNRYAVLTGVSCVSASACVAVGYYRGPSEMLAPLAERWDGTEWMLLTVPLPASASAGRLEGVSCVAGDECTAVGSSTDESDVETTLVESFDGAEWEIEESPNPIGVALSRLLAVSCTSSTSCTAVGFSEPGVESKSTLAERWNGGEWSIQSTENPPGNEASNRFEGVSCPTATTCDAVGFHLERVGSRYVESSLVERWNGSEWTSQEAPAPPAATEGTHLTSVSCPSSGSCTAAGYYLSPNGEGGSSAEVMGLRWSGASWSLLGMVGLPDPAGWWHDRWLDGLSCAEAEACVGVGSSLSAPEGGSSSMRAFAERELVASSEEGGGSPEGGGAPPEVVPPPPPPPPPLPSGFKVEKVIRGAQGRVVLRVVAPVDGRFTASARTRTPSRRWLSYGKASSSAAAYGVLKLTIVPLPGAVRALDAYGRLLVRVTVDFSSASGGLASERRTVLVHK